MAAEGGTRAVGTALGANLGVAVAKFVAAAITGSTSMLAEGVHSVADSGNQVLLLIGGKRARQAPSALHPASRQPRRRRSGCRPHSADARRDPQPDKSHATDLNSAGPQAAPCTFCDNAEFGRRSGSTWA